MRTSSPLPRVVAGSLLKRSEHLKRWNDRQVALTPPATAGGAALLTWTGGLRPGSMPLDGACDASVSQDTLTIRREGRQLELRASTGAEPSLASWDAVIAVATRGHTGWLQKQSGGYTQLRHAPAGNVLKKWDRRWFWLIGPELFYYLSERDLEGPATGSLDLTGATVDLGEDRTLRVHTAVRILTLRASDDATCAAWRLALSFATAMPRPPHEDEDHLGERSDGSGVEGLSNADGALVAVFSLGLCVAVYSITSLHADPALVGAAACVALLLLAATRARALADCLRRWCGPPVPRRVSLRVRQGRGWLGAADRGRDFPAPHQRLVEEVDELRDKVGDGLIKKGFTQIEAILDAEVRKAVEKEIFSDPWAPAALGRVLSSAWDGVWPRFIAALRENYLIDHGSSFDRIIRRRLIRLVEPTQWPPAPPAWPNLPRWLRCRLLYAVYPADRTWWYVVQTPKLLPFFLLAVAGPLVLEEASLVWTLMLYLQRESNPQSPDSAQPADQNPGDYERSRCRCIIDRHDDYQLLNYLVWVPPARFGLTIS
jgi:hypothetical protein